jgi:DtxR family Mn-dependent transcriptional regulator
LSSSDTLSASLEDYLKAIDQITAEKQAARAKDISSRLQVNMSSVTGALRALAERDLINYAPYELVTLTEKGREVARDVVRRHESLRDFLVKVLAFDPDYAATEACRLEHAVSAETLERIIQFMDYVEMCPRVGTQWLEEFGYRCDHPDHEDNCQRCIEDCIEDLKKKESSEAARKVIGLDKLKPGRKGKIVKIAGGNGNGKRIVEMGVTPGTLIEVERVAPLGDPIQVKVRGYHLSLRRDEANRISVEEI